MKSDYPKVLIIGQTFNRETGGGITLSNLFSNWPEDKIFVVASKKSCDTSNFNVCSNVYQTGYNENKMRWPFYYFQPRYYSGFLKEKKIDHSPNFKKQSSLVQLKNLIVILKYCYNLLKIDNVFSRLILSKELKSSIKAFQPDILYTQLSSYDSIMFTKDVTEKIDVPLVIHIMDDWPSTIANRGLINKLYFKRVIGEEFEKLLKKASALFSISEYMSEEYYKRFGLEFIAFQNCIDLDFWNGNKIGSSNNHFTILYAGRIGVGTSSSLLDIAKVIDQINEDGLEVCFEIQTNDLDAPVVNELKKNRCVNFIPRLPYEELPSKFASADMLVLPIDFEEDSSRFLKYSMPTKVPEYLSVGVPVMVVSPSDSAMVKLFEKHNLGYVVTEKNIRNIKEIIISVIKDQNQSIKYINNALDFVKINKECGKVRNHFRQELINANRRYKKM